MEVYIRNEETLIKRIVDHMKRLLGVWGFTATRESRTGGAIPIGDEKLRKSLLSWRVGKKLHRVRKCVLKNGFRLSSCFPFQKGSYTKRKMVSNKGNDKQLKL